MTDENPQQAPGQAPTPGAPGPEQSAANPELDAARSESQASADNLGVPGALEVEEMPESNQLKNLRSQTHDSLTEVGDAEEKGGAAFGSADGSGFMDLLSEAGLSPRHFKFCCGGIVVILILVGLVFGGIRLIQNLQDRPERVEEVEEVGERKGEEEEKEEEDKKTPEELGINDTVDVTIYGGVIIGEEVAEVDESTEAGEALGEELTSDDGLAQMIKDFAQMYEAMQVGVQELLDQSRSRQETLDDYRHDLNYLLYVGRQNLEELQKDKSNIEDRFVIVEEEKNAWEEQFFEDLRELDTYASVNALNEFIVAGEEVVNLRAQYHAREKLISYYETLIVDMEQRVEDLRLNEEALVKGIRVVDMEGSDLDLIIQESEL